MTTIDRRGLTVGDTSPAVGSSDPSANLAIKTPARVATTANITLNGLQTIDGVTVSESDRVLVKDQSDATQNGIYLASSGNWTRTTDFDSVREVVKGALVVVNEGTIGQRSEWFVASSDPITPGSTALTFQRFSPAISVFNTLADVQAASVDSAINVIRTGGYTTAGDLGGAFYKRVVSQPSHNGKVQSADGAWWEIAEPVLSVFMFGAKGDNSTDDTTAIRNTAACAIAQGTDSAGGPAGSWGAPAGYIFKTTGTIDIDKASCVDFRSFIYYNATSGAAVRVNNSLPTVGRNQDFKLHFAGLRSVPGNSATPTGVTVGGTIGLQIKNLQFSGVSVGVILGFTYAGFYCDSTNSTYSGQHIQQNFFDIGQVGYCGYGVLLNSASAATGATSANWFRAQDVFSNWINLQVDIPANYSSSSNVFDLVALDADAGGGSVNSNSYYNRFNIQFLNGTVTMGAGTTNNWVQIGNTLATGAAKAGDWTSNLFVSGVVDAQFQLAAFVAGGFAAQAISLSALTNGLALSVVGVTGNAGAAHADISGTANQVLRVNSAGTALTFGQLNLASSAAVTGVLPEVNGGTNQSTYTLGDILYSSALNTLSKLPGNTTTSKKFLRQTGSGASSAAPAWDTILAADVPGAALTKTDDTNVTLTLAGSPTTALLAATSVTVGWTGQLALTRGGLNASLTASLGGIFYSTASAGAILAGTATANLPLLSGASAEPVWASISYPASATSGGVPYFSSTSAIASSALLAADAIMVGGGAGTAPKTTPASVNGSGDISTSGSNNAALFNSNTFGYYVSGAQLIDATGKFIAGIITPVPVTKTGTSSTQGATEWSIIFNPSGTFTETLLAASAHTGRWLHVKSIAAQAINSASSNVVPLGSATAGTALLASGVGKWASLQSDGTNWVVMAGG